MNQQTYLWIRFLNKLSYLTGLKPQPFNIQETKIIAEKETGLDDWGDSKILDIAEIAAQHVIADDNITSVGWLAMKAIFLKHMKNRLIAVETLKRNPEIRDVEISRPIFIIGWYRTGTTLLHHLLSALPQTRTLKYWELANPWGNKQINFIKSHWEVFTVNLLMKGLEDVHPIRAKSPEECMHLLTNSGYTVWPFTMMTSYQYAWWLLEQDLQDMYCFFKDQLKIFLVNCPERLVLKCPFHMWHLDSLLTLFPDACIIQLHRDAARAIPSVCNFNFIMKRSLCKKIDRERLGSFWSDYCEMGITRSLKARKNLPNKQVCDILYNDLVTSPVQVIEKIAAEFDLSIDKANLPQVIAQITNGLKGRKSRYSLAQFGLNGAQLQQRFASYYQQFGIVAESI